MPRTPFSTHVPIPLSRFANEIDRENWTTATSLARSESSDQNCSSWASTCAGCTHQQDIKRGRGCYTLDSFQLGSIITGFPRGLRNLKNPPSTASPPSRPPPNINTNANQPISKNSKISIVSHESVVGLMLSIPGPGNRDSTHHTTHTAILGLSQTLPDHTTMAGHPPKRETDG